MNLELIKHSVEDSGLYGDAIENIIKQIRDSKKELELIKRSLMHGIADVNRTGNDGKLHEAYSDFDAFLNPEIFEPTHSSDPAVDYEKEYTSKEPDLDFHGQDPLVQASIITRNKALSDGMATIEADGEVTYSN